MNTSTVIQYPAIYQLEKERHLQAMLEAIKKLVEPVSFKKLEALARNSGTAYDSLAMSGRWKLSAPEALLRLTLEMNEAGNMRLIALTETE